MQQVHTQLVGRSLSVGHGSFGAACWSVIFWSLVANTAMEIALSRVGAQDRGSDSYGAARKRMVQDFVAGAGITDQRVLDALQQTPRHEFVSRQYRDQAYEDMALPIGDKQTISSPFIVAFMTEALAPRPSDRVLEIGTGSGYQAAVLSPLVADVYTIEIVEALGLTARKTLERLGYQNVHTKVGDGFQGWPEHAPFDKIIVTCSPEDVPQPLIDQLKEGGRIVVPVGQRYQQILYIMRKENGQLAREALRPTLFVPMTGAAEDRRQVQPDPLDPQIANGGFEKEALETGFVPDWYYQRQTRQLSDGSAPAGHRFLRVENQQPGKPGFALQGFAINGQQISRLEVSCSLRYEGVRPGRTKEELAAVVVTFYDRNRAPLGYRWLGPFQGSAPWHRERAVLRVPREATEGIIRIGLFGAVGQIDFDEVQIKRL